MALFTVDFTSGMMAPLLVLTILFKGYTGVMSGPRYYASEVSRLVAAVAEQLQPPLFHFSCVNWQGGTRRYSERYVQYVQTLARTFKEKVIELYKAVLFETNRK